jgi:hypothetical protein
VHWVRRDSRFKDGVGSQDANALQMVKAVINTTANGEDSGASAWACDSAPITNVVDSSGKLDGVTGGRQRLAIKVAVPLIRVMVWVIRGCRRKLKALCRRVGRRSIHGMAGIGAWNTTSASCWLTSSERTRERWSVTPPPLRAPVARRRNGEPISTAFMEGAVNEIIAKRMNKKQQMRWNRATVQPFLDVRSAVLKDTLEDVFRCRYPGLRDVKGRRARRIGGVMNPTGLHALFGHELIDKGAVQVGHSQIIAARAREVTSTSFRYRCV